MSDGQRPIQWTGPRSEREFMPHPVHTGVVAALLDVAGPLDSECEFSWSGGAEHPPPVR